MDLIYLNNFNKAIISGFSGGKPPHLSEPHNSAFHIVTHDMFEKMSVKEIQDIFRKRHILVTNIPSAAMEFDSKGLSTLTSLSTVTYMQGVSNFRYGIAHLKLFQINPSPEIRRPISTPLIVS